MARKTNRRRRYAPPVWTETAQERLEWASRSFGVLTAPPHDWSTSPRLVVQLARECHVDPRWLAVGVPSRAGAAAGRQFCRATTFTPSLDVPAELIERLLVVTPEPDLGAGVCRYCLCTDAAGCAHGDGGSCWWVDGAATICSACLEPGEE